MVTGGEGFLGRAVVDSLSRAGFDRIIRVARRTDLRKNVINPDWRGVFHNVVDLTNGVDISDLMFSSPPDIVVHCAAVSNLRDARNDPGVTRVNVVGTHNLLLHCPPKTRFVYLSSASVYGNANADCWEAFTALPTSVYSASKLAGEELVRVFARQGKIVPLILRPVAMVGKGATHGLVRDVAEKVKSPGRELPLCGIFPGSDKPFVHVRDVADFITYCLRYDVTAPNTYNVGPLGGMTVADVARHALEIFGVEKELSWDGRPWEGDNPVVRIDNAAAVRAGYRPDYSDSVSAVRAALFEYKGLS